MGSKNTKTSQSGRDVVKSKRHKGLKEHFIENAIKFYQEDRQGDYATNLPNFLDAIELPPNYSREQYEVHFTGIYETIKDIYETADSQRNMHTSISIDDIKRNRFLLDDDIRNILKNVLDEKLFPSTKSAQKRDYKKNDTKIMINLF